MTRIMSKMSGTAQRKIPKTISLDVSAKHISPTGEYLKWPVGDVSLCSRYFKGGFDLRDKAAAPEMVKPQRNT